MIDHNDPRKFLQERCQVGKVGRLEIDHDMPAEPLHPFGGAKEQLARRRIDQPFDEIEPDTANTGRIHPVQLVIGNVMRHHGNPAGHAAGGLKRVDHRAVVLAVAAGLHDHVAGQAQMVAKREQLVLAGISGGVFALGRKGKFRGRAEDMAMRVDRPSRGYEIGLFRAGVPGHLTACHRIDIGHCHLSPFQKIMPSKSLRAVRTMPAFSTCPSASQ